MFAPSSLARFCAQRRLRARVGSPLPLGDAGAPFFDDNFRRPP
mgnify:CR=1 FL=1|jgi:hypothetical protein